MTHNDGGGFRRIRMPGKGKGERTRETRKGKEEGKGEKER